LVTRGAFGSACFFVRAGLGAAALAFRDFNFEAPFAAFVAALVLGFAWFFGLLGAAADSVFGSVMVVSPGPGRPDRAERR
jgi:hypothetical protein